MTLFAKRDAEPKWARSAKLWATASFVVVVLTQVTLPLAPSAAATLVTSTVVFLTITSCLIATLSYRPEQILRVGIVIAVVAFVIEFVGSTTGLPFGRYHYGPGLQPQIASVPLLVPLAWLAMILPALELGRLLTTRGWLQALIGGWALMCWDLFLDPLMTSYRYWIWAGPGDWEGIPLSNFAGWLLAGTAMTAIAGRLLPRSTINPGLIGIYAWMVGFSALGFLVPIAFDRPNVAVVGIVALLPLAVSTYWRRGALWPTS